MIHSARAVGKIIGVCWACVAMRDRREWKDRQEFEVSRGLEAMASVWV